YAGVSPNVTAAARTSAGIVWASSVELVATTFTSVSTPVLSVRGTNQTVAWYGSTRGPFLRARGRGVPGRSTHLARRAARRRVVAPARARRARARPRGLRRATRLEPAPRRVRLDLPGL